MFRQLQKEIQLPWSTFQVDAWVQGQRHVKDFEMVDLGASLIN